MLVTIDNVESSWSRARMINEGVGEVPVGEETQLAAVPVSIGAPGVKWKSSALPSSVSVLPQSVSERQSSSASPREYLNQFLEESRGRENRA